MIGEEPIVFEAVKGESKSLEGLLLEMHGRLPHVSEKIRYRHFIFTIISVDDRKIKKVQVSILSKREPHPLSEKV